MQEKYNWGRTNGNKPSFSVFSVSDDVTVNRLGKKIYAKGKDGTYTESDTVEANLLFEILKALKSKR